MKVFSENENISDSESSTLYNMINSDKVYKIKLK